MGYARECYAQQMEIAGPDAPSTIIPVVWYFAPTDAKLYRGVSAFGPAQDDRDSVDPAFRPLWNYTLGVQFPPFLQRVVGRNVWGYTGQCTVGTAAQFAGGLTAADLAAAARPIPACCAAVPPQQVWYLRSNLRPRQYPQPGVFVGAWDNQGDAAVPGLLDDRPGTVLQEVDFTDSQPPYAIRQVGVQQYLSGRLTPQEMGSKPWGLAIGVEDDVVAPHFAELLFGFYLIDGETGGIKQTLREFGQLTNGILAILSPHAVRVRFATPTFVASWGDYLCLEVGVHYQPGLPLAPWTLNLAFRDSGRSPIADGLNPNGDPLSVLSYPADQEDDDVPATGSLVPFAAATIPAGYLDCDGSAPLISSFPALFAILGNAWGAAPAGHFRLPDLRDRVPIGTSPGGLTGSRPTARALADVGGEEAHVLITNELASHSHGLIDPGHVHAAGPTANFWTDFPFGTAFNPGAVNNIQQNPTTDVATTGITLVPTGLDVAHNTMQPFAAVRWLIKT